MRGVAIGVEQRNGDHLRRERARTGHDVGDGVGLERLLDAVRSHPLANRNRELVRHEGVRMLAAEVVECGARLPAQGEQIAGARGGAEHDARARSLEERVRGHGGPVDEARDVGAGDRQRLDRGHHAACLVVGRRQHLAGGDAAVVAHRHEVGERAADVDADRVARHRARCRDRGETSRRSVRVSERMPTQSPRRT